MNNMLTQINDCSTGTRMFTWYFGYIDLLLEILEI